jgi:hypothetical protein
MDADPDSFGGFVIGVWVWWDESIETWFVSDATEKSGGDGGDSSVAGGGGDIVVGLILENLLRVRFGELDARMPMLIESISLLSPEAFTLFLLRLSTVENDEASRQVLPHLFVEELLKFCWGEAEEGEDRESPIQAILAGPVEMLTEMLLLLKSGSKDEVLLAIAERWKRRSGSNFPV